MIALYSQYISEMLNKNVANYTDFDGKTNKRIVQAPGGASSLNLGWSNEKTDYGPQRNIGKAKDKYNNEDHGLGGNQGYGNGYSQHQTGEYQGYGYAAKPSQQADNSQLGGYYGYKPYSQAPLQQSSPYSNGYSYSPPALSNPYSQPSPAYSYNKYSPYTPSNGASKNDYLTEQINAINYGVRGYEKRGEGYGAAYQGGQNGYGQNSYMSQGNTRGSYGGSGVYRTGQVEELDLALKQYDRGTNKPKSVSHNQSAEYEYRPSIKVLGPPPQQHMIGNPNYNFWKDNTPDNIGVSGSHRQVHSEKKIGSGEREERPAERTSVKVNNPPGGKQSFVLG